jgi:hypothetical protein
MDGAVTTFAVVSGVFGVLGKGLISQKVFEESLMRLLERSRTSMAGAAPGCRAALGIRRGLKRRVGSVLAQ